MRRAALAVVSTTAGLVMLLSFKTHPEVTRAAALSTGSGSTSGVTSPVVTPTGAASASPSTAAVTTKTVMGDAVDTRWGPVQVQITVTRGKITAATAVVYPQGNGRDQEINSYAVPALEQETVAASSAKIDMVSGATYTSTGYIASLQSALDKA